MKIGDFNSTRFGFVEVNIKDIGALFGLYQKEYNEIFKLNNNQFESLRKFDLKSGGELVTLNSVDRTLAVMTFRNIDNDFKELGDVMKLVPMFPRSDFATGLSIASKVIAEKGYCIIGYPNKYALPMELQAGYQILKTYTKVNYVVLMGCAFLLPLESRCRKLRVNLKHFKMAPLLLFGLRLRKTRLRKRFLRVYALSNKSFKNRNILDLGILYKYIINDNDNGSPIIFFGDCRSDKIPLGYEYSVNSA